MSRRIEAELDCGVLGQRKFRITYGTWVDGSPDCHNVEMWDKDGWFDIDGWMDEQAIIDAIVSYELEP